jgi:hypothetical protein
VAGPVGTGSKLPDIVFKDGLPGEERAYLGLSQKTDFSFKDFAGSLFITEVFNTYCTICPANVSVLNDVYSFTRDDPKLRGTIKIVAIAVGNNIIEIKSFNKAYHVLYPVIPDPLFTAHKALGNPRVPYTLFIKKSAKGNMVVFVHNGVLHSAEEVLRELRSYLKK